MTKVVQTGGGNRLLDHAAEDDSVIDAAIRCQLDKLAREPSPNISAHHRLNPALQRASDFAHRFFASALSASDISFQFPSNDQLIILEKPGMARNLSLPPGQNEYRNAAVSSFRLANHQGILHNTTNDKRTTAGIFHISEGGPVIHPGHTKSVPQVTSATLLCAALNPGWRPGRSAPDLSHRDLMAVPWKSSEDKTMEALVSLYCRPPVAPKIPGVSRGQDMEITVLAPAGLVSNLDFLERIFSNAGDPSIPTCDASLDIQQWGGQSAMLIFAPHLTKLTKKELGLPHKDKATAKQINDGMCYENPEELYNGGKPFKLCIRDGSNTAIMVVADNYFGYGKKGFKDLMSRACNMNGHFEEDHAGGTIAYRRVDLGEVFDSSILSWKEHSFEKLLAKHNEDITLQAGGFATHQRMNDLVLLPERAVFNTIQNRISWSFRGQEYSQTISSKKRYVLPNGVSITYCPEVKIGAEGQLKQWRLIADSAEGVVLHKPDSVSGAGKSEVSKPATDAIIKSVLSAEDASRCIETAKELASMTFPNRYKPEALKRLQGQRAAVDSGTRIGTEEDQKPIPRKLFNRSIGALLKILTPSDTDFEDSHNYLIRSIHPSVRGFLVRARALYDGKTPIDEFFSRFTTRSINGQQGTQIFYNGRPMFCDQMRVGKDENGDPRLFTLRADYVPTQKILTEDDISVGQAVPTPQIKNLSSQVLPALSCYFVENPEHMLFQRPDDGIHRGYDAKAEADFARPNGFYTNYEPIPLSQADALIADEREFDKFTAPMQNLIRQAAEAHKQGETGYFVCTAFPRIVDGKPTENPRYLQIRPDFDQKDEIKWRDFCSSLSRQTEPNEPIPHAVQVFVPGRRLQPQYTRQTPEGPQTVRSLAVMGPLHVQEMPELLMELITSLTGRSPSTTGEVSSEGARTKGPFNQLPGIVDIENAMVSMLLNDKLSFISAAGYVGPKYNVGHDISTVIPELFARLLPEQRTWDFFVKRGWLEKLEDYTIELDGEPMTIPQSRLGWRLTEHGREELLGLIFENPATVFPEDMLKPEKQDHAQYSDGILNIVEAQQRIASLYFNDGSIEIASPPLRSLLHIMRDGFYQDPESGERWTMHSENFRKQFTLNSMLESSWYKQRLVDQQILDVHNVREQIAALRERLSEVNGEENSSKNLISKQIEILEKRQQERASPEYLENLQNSIGVHSAILNWKGMSRTLQTTSELNGMQT